MTTLEKTRITVATEINAPVEKVWNLWTDPEHIVHWNNASDDWHTPKAENDLRTGGRFLSHMEARDGSSGFDFTGVYTGVEPHKQIAYTLDDGRKVMITFQPEGAVTWVTEIFEAEQTNSEEMQRSGWQAILDNFKRYVESSGKFEVLHFKKIINANVAKVYRIMLGETTWKEWTKVFNPAAYFEGNWEKGSKMLFLGTDQDGSIGGMASRIRENIPGRYLSIEHIAVVHKGKKIASRPETENWAGALENYSFTEVNGKTLLSVDMYSTSKFKSYFNETWPKALEKLKSICED